MRKPKNEKSFFQEKKEERKKEQEARKQEGKKRKEGRKAGRLQKWLLSLFRPHNQS